MPKYVALAGEEVANLIVIEDDEVAAYEAKTGLKLVPEHLFQTQQIAIGIDAPPEIISEYVSP